MHGQPLFLLRISKGDKQNVGTSFGYPVQDLLVVHLIDGPGCWRVSANYAQVRMTLL